MDEAYTRGLDYESIGRAKKYLRMTGSQNVSLNWIDGGVCTQIVGWGPRGQLWARSRARGEGESNGFGIARKEETDLLQCILHSLRMGTQIYHENWTKSL